jgi:hypothetical protein
MLDLADTSYTVSLCCAMLQSLKAAGVTINVGLVGPDRTKELLTFTTALGMEGILQVKQVH